MALRPSMLTRAPLDIAPFRRDAAAGYSPMQAPFYQTGCDNARMIRTSNAAAAAGWLALVALLAAYLFTTASRVFPDQLGYDLYHPWGVASVHDALAGQANPYADTRRYAEAIGAVADASRSIKAQLAHAFWGERSAARIEPTGTPLYYAALRFLPADYDRAHLTYAILQFLAAGLGVFLLARLKGVGAGPALCLAVAAEITYNPFIQDVKMGNANSLQLLFLVGMLWVASRQLYLRHRAVDRMFLGAIALFVVFKPNTVWIALALGVHYLAVRGPRNFAIGAAIAAGAALAGFAYGAWYFRDAGVWWDWVRYTQGLNGGSLLYTLDAGNQALAMLMAEKSGGFGTYGYCLVIAAVMLLALLVAISGGGKRTDLVDRARRLFADPGFALSAGIVFMFATAPLLWPHYFMLSLVPIAWLFRVDRRWGLETGCAVASYAFNSTLLIQALVAAKLIGLVHTFMFFCWVPLAVGLLAYAGRERHATPAAA